MKFELIYLINHIHEKNRAQRNEAPCFTKRSQDKKVQRGCWMVVKKMR